VSETHNQSFESNMAMSSWIETYTSSLDARDALTSHPSLSYIAPYTRYADHYSNTSHTTSSTPQNNARQAAKIKDLEQRLRDREEELRGKTRLLENTQDEIVSLTLQLNMAEERAERLKGENEDLVRRWMERMGSEAERMNLGSGF